ncbi:MAG: FGGY-family carbohydrate kinase [Candidatus Caldarchaeum sp.]
MGTGSVKAVALSDEGKVVWQSHRDLPNVVADGEKVEFDAEIWYARSIDLLREFASKFKPRDLTLCIGGQAPSIVPVDRNGRPLHHALVWMDGRAVAEAEKLRNLTGEDVDPFTAESKLLWFMNNLPSVYKKTFCFLHAFDFVAFRLTGSATVGLLDEQYYTWESIPYWKPEHLSMTEFELEKLPEPRLIGDEIGPVKESVAKMLNIPSTTVIQGTADFAHSIVGVGAVKPSVAMDHGGTSQGFDLCWHEELRPSKREFNCVRHIVRGFWNISGVMNTTGAVLRWFRNNFYPPESSYTLVDAEAAKCENVQLIVLPYFQGERTPVWNPYARGVFFGLQLRHGRGDVARAIMEATAYGLRRIVEFIKKAGGRLDELRVAGGQGNSDLWNQIKADVLGVKVIKPSISDAAPLGAALVGAVSKQIYKDYSESAEKAVVIEKTFNPNPTKTETYDKKYETYIELYEAVKHLFIKLDH